MYQRFHTDTSDKWQQVPRVGLTPVMREEWNGWHLQISHRRVGSTIRRDQFNVIIRRDKPAYQEYLTGFPTKTAALAAARSRIDLLRRPTKRIRKSSRIWRARSLER